MDENKLLDAIRQIVKEEVSQAVDAKMDEKLEPLKVEMSGIKAELEKMEEESRQSRVLIEAGNHKMGLLCEALAETKSKFGQLDRMEQTLNDLKSESAVTRDVVKFHSVDIAALKKAL